MEYYSAIRKNDYTTFAATWTGLEGYHASEISQSEKDNYHLVSRIYGTKEVGRAVGEEGEKERGGKQKGE